MERNNLKDVVYVGDTRGDADSAKIAGIPFVYAEYGFGHVDEYDYKIEKFEDLKKLFLNSAKSSSANSKTSGFTKKTV